MYKKPLPNIDPDNEPLFEGYKEHKFNLFRCTECGEWYWPKAFCRNHDNEPHFGNIKVEEASGEGELFAFTVTHRPFHPGFEDDVPYVFSMVKLDEGPLFGTQLIEINHKDVKIGMPVEVSFRDIPAADIPKEKREKFPLEDGFTLPYFAPTEGGNMT